MSKTTVSPADRSPIPEESEIRLALGSLQMLDVKRINPTKTKGMRVKITDMRFDESIVIPFDFKYAQALDVALQYLYEFSTLVPAGYGLTKDHYFIVIRPVDGFYTTLKDSIKNRETYNQE